MSSCTNKRRYDDDGGDDDDDGLHMRNLLLPTWPNPSPILFHL